VAAGFAVIQDNQLLKIQTSFDARSSPTVSADYSFSLFFPGVGFLGGIHKNWIAPP
jgi:hypothetical protein